MRYGRIRHGVVGVHEGTEEVLAVADHSRVADVGNADRLDAGVGSRAVRVHAILIR